MKTLQKAAIVLVCLISLNGLHAQQGYNGSILPLKPQSPLFGKDIVIHDSSAQNQGQVAICSAFNGWLYSVYSYSSALNTASTTVLRSKDGGLTWSIILDVHWPMNNSVLLSLDIAVTGDSISNLKVVLAAVLTQSNLQTGMGSLYVVQFNGNNGENGKPLLNDSGYCVSLATDLPFPSNLSHPESLGVILSKHSPTGSQKDSVIFYSSSTGDSLDNKKIIAVTSNHRYRKVSLAYGRSPSWPLGNYFAVWEQRDSFDADTANIFIAHTTSGINSPFTPSVQLDNLDPLTNGKARNPVIACQSNNIDNDSANMTEVVLVEKYIPSSHQYDLEGFYNLQAANHDYFNKMIVSNPVHYNLQPSIDFNPYDSTFMATFYDSTTRKLPFITNNFNLINPDFWQYISVGYNDSLDLAKPYPKVKLDIAQQQGVNVWSEEGVGGNGIALFDAPFSTWTGIPNENNLTDYQALKVYPNPCLSVINIDFSLNVPCFVKIYLINQFGQQVGDISEKYYQLGQTSLKFDISNYPSGCYLISFSYGTNYQSKKIIISK